LILYTDPIKLTESRVI